MASTTLFRRITPRCNLVRSSHTSSRNSNLTGIFPLPAKTASLTPKPLTSKRSLQSIAHLKNATKLTKSNLFDPIDAGSKRVSTDPCLFAVTLGELREAKYQSKKLQERILRWIWEGESWSVFAENNVQITKVKLLPSLRTLKIYWSATGVQYIDKLIQKSLDESVSLEIEERMKYHKDYQGSRLPEIEFVADMSQAHASEFARGGHMQHPYRLNRTSSKQSTEELFQMQNITGISSLKALEPITANGGNGSGVLLEEDYIEKSEIHGLDYNTVMAQLLQEDPLLRI